MTPRRVVYRLGPVSHLRAGPFDLVPPVALAIAQLAPSDVIFQYLESKRLARADPMSCNPAPGAGG